MIVRIRHQKCCHHAGQLTACTCNLTHFRSAVANHIAFLTIGYKINSTCNGDNGTGFCGKLLHKLNCLIQCFLSYSICYIRVHTLCGTASQGQCLNLGNIASDHRQFQLFHQLNRCIRTKGRCTGTYRIQKDWMIQFIRFPSCTEHTFNTALCQRADIDIQTAADGCDIFHIFRLRRHNRAAAAGQQYISYIIDCYIIRDIMNKRNILSHILNTISKHFLTLLLIFASFFEIIHKFST